MSVAAHLKELGIELPAPAAAVGPSTASRSPSPSLRSGEETS